MAHFNCVTRTCVYNRVFPSGFLLPASAGLIAAACRVVTHWNTCAQHHRLWHDIDWLKSAEKYQGKHHMTVLAGCSSSGAHPAVKKKLPVGSSIPHQTLATDVFFFVWGHNLQLSWGYLEKE